jgi:hypothetical protein
MTDAPPVDARFRIGMTADFPEPDRGLLAAGLCWLYDTVQPGDSVIPHHGTGHGYADGTRSYSFSSEGAHHLPAIVIMVRHWDYGPDGEIAHLLTAAEIDATAAAITELGGDIARTWNGAGSITGGFGLADPAHWSLRHAVNRYREGCPEHKTVFCNQADFAARGGYEPCTWYAAGFARIVQPAWTIHAQA